MELANMGTSDLDPVQAYSNTRSGISETASLIKRTCLVREKTL